MGRIVTFGLGGFDPTKPNNNIVSDENVSETPSIADIARNTAIEKLKRLGLTEEEISALLGN